MIKVLAIERHLERATICIETEHTYQFLTIDHHDNIEHHDHYTKADYKDFERFVGVFGKFDPHTLFLENPIVLDELTWAEFYEKAYPRLWKEWNDTADEPLKIIKADGTQLLVHPNGEEEILTEDHPQYNHWHGK